jgi:hypothetical protein
MCGPLVADAGQSGSARHPLTRRTSR